jgi:hypothetical protein
MTAARRDVVAIRDRIAAGERLLERFRTNAAEIGAVERERAGRLDAMARTGLVELAHGSLPMAQCGRPPRCSRPVSCSWSATTWRR